MVGLAAVLAFQQRTIRRLRTETRQSAEKLLDSNEPAPESQTPPAHSDLLQQEELKRLRLENRDILRLRNEVRQLRDQLHESERTAETLRRTQIELMARNTLLIDVLTNFESSVSFAPSQPPQSFAQIPRNSYIGAVFTGSFTNSQLEGVAINSVVADSAAAEAQLQSGDIILRIDGQPMTTVEQIVRTIAGHNPGDKLHFNFLRDGLPQQVTVTTKPPPGVTVITKPPLDNLPR